MSGKCLKEKEFLAGLHQGFLQPGGITPPSAFSSKCSAERSMPANSAVREMLPEKC